MIGDNINTLRKYKGLSQEEVAADIGVSRQTLSKWETGESLPDIEKSYMLAEYFGVSLDELVNFQTEIDSDIVPPPKGKHLFGVVKVGDKGQVVIPARARKIFDIKTGDRIIVLGDEGQGIALVKEKGFLDMFKKISEMK